MFDLLLRVVVAHEQAWQANHDAMTAVRRSIPELLVELGQAQSAMIACPKRSPRTMCPCHGPEVKAARKRLDAAKASLPKVTERFKAGVTKRDLAAAMA